MADEERAMFSADDAELLNMVRAGDTAAFQFLYQRHEHAARRLARGLVVNAADVDDVLARTADQLLQIIRVGGGPADAFRPYLLNALRQVCDGRPATDQAADPAGASPDRPLIVTAFLSLPERWMAVLWHTEIEGTPPAEAAPLFGLSRNGVAELRRSAKYGLSRAYLQMYATGAARPECTAVAVRLGAFIQDAVAGPDSATVTEHLSQCDDCRAVFAELSDVSIPLRATVAPVFLGSSAGYYLSGTTAGHSHTVAAAVTPAATTASTAWRARLGTLARDGARPVRWLAAGAAAVIAAGVIVVAGALGGHGSPLKQTSKDQAESAGLPRPAATIERPSAAAARSVTTAVPTDPASARRGSSTPASAPASPAPPPATSLPPARPNLTPSAVRLTAAVDIYSGHHNWKGAVVVFRVGDTGSAATGTLTVSVALPAGTSLATWPHRPGHWHGVSDQGSQGGEGGWTCRATASGARCRHAPIPAREQSQGLIFIAIEGSSACGQSVSVTAASGSASASARSPESIRC